MTMTSGADPSQTAVSCSPPEGTTPKQVWIDGGFVDQDRATVSVYDHGFLYGDGCFEGIRAYNGRILKLTSHLERLYRSADAIRLEPAYTIEEIDRAVRDTVVSNGLRDAYIRLIFSRGVGTLGLHPFKCKRTGTVIIADSIELYPPDLYETGLKVVVASRPRIPVKCLDPKIKSLNYLNNILAKIEAIDANVLEAIMLNTEGFVSECTGDNIFIVKDGAILTPADEAGFLHGITRQFVMSEIAPACGFAVEEKMLRIDDVLAADEVFLTGTAAEVIAVRQVDETVVGNGSIGPITRELADEFRRRVSSDAPED